MAIKTIKKRVYAIFANCITPVCKLYFSEQSSRYHPLSILLKSPLLRGINNFFTINI